MFSEYTFNRLVAELRQVDPDKADRLVNTRKALKAALERLDRLAGVLVQRARMQAHG